MKIGVDIGGMSIKFGLVDEENQIIAKTVIPTELDIPYQNLVGKMADAVKQLLEERHLTLEDCDGIGIGCPGTINDETGVVIYSNNIRWENLESTFRLILQLQTMRMRLLSGKYVQAQQKGQRRQSCSHSEQVLAVG